MRKEASNLLPKLVAHCFVILLSTESAEEPFNSRIYTYCRRSGSLRLLLFPMAKHWGFQQRPPASGCDRLKLCNLPNTQIPLYSRTAKRDCTGGFLFSVNLCQGDHSLLGIAGAVLNIGPIHTVWMFTNSRMPNTDSSRP
jgi:hypothetical protein